VVKRGTLVDATLIAAAVKRPAYGGDGVNSRDPDARFTKKRGKTYFGYKAHVAVDEGSGLVRKAQMTSANLHDIRLGEAMILGDEKGFFADKAMTARRCARPRLVSVTPSRTQNYAYHPPIGLQRRSL